MVSAQLGLPSAIRQYLRGHGGDPDLDLITSYVISWADAPFGPTRISSVEGVLSGSGSTMVLASVSAVVNYILQTQGHQTKNGAAKPGLTIRVRRTRNPADRDDDRDPP